MMISLFCASGTKIPDIYFEETGKLAEILTDKGFSFCYGGGAVGLMGIFADKVLEHNGSITGVIPEFMVALEWAHEKATSMITVNDMFERKRILIEKADAILVLPGGTGTFDELFEALTLKQLGQHAKPIVIYNIDRYFDPLLVMLRKMTEQFFLRKEHLEMFSVANTAEEVIRALENPGKWHESYISLAQI